MPEPIFRDQNIPIEPVLLLEKYGRISSLQANHFNCTSTSGIVTHYTNTLAQSVKWSSRSCRTIMTIQLYTGLTQTVGTVQ